MKTGKKIVLKNGDVAALRVTKHGSFVLLAVFDRSSLTRPLIQALLLPKEHQTLLQALSKKPSVKKQSPDRAKPSNKANERSV